MKKLLAIVVFCSLTISIGCTKSKPFEEVYKQQVDELSVKKSQAIPFDDFFQKSIRNKSTLQTDAQKAEWQKTNNWPITFFRHKILSIKNIEMTASNKFVENNKDHFAQVTLSTKIDYKNIFISFYILKQDALKLKEGEIFKGYGIMYNFNYSYGEYFFYFYPVIAK